MLTDLDATGALALTLLMFVFSIVTLKHTHVK